MFPSVAGTGLLEPPAKVIKIHSRPIFGMLALPISNPAAPAPHHSPPASSLEEAHEQQSGAVCVQEGTEGAGGAHQGAAVGGPLAEEAGERRQRGKRGRRGAGQADTAGAPAEPQLADSSCVDVVLATASQDRFFVLSRMQLTSGRGTYTPAAVARVRAIGEETDKAVEAAAVGSGSNVGEGSHGPGAGPHAHAHGQGDGQGKGGGAGFSGWRRSATDKAAGVAASAAAGAARETFRVAIGPPPPASSDVKQHKRLGEVGFGGPLLRLPEALRER